MWRFGQGDAVGRGKAVWVEVAAAIAALGVVLYARLANLHYNTLFLDEAIYAVIGEDLLAGSVEREGVRWMFASYLYPALAGLLSAVGGVTALRVGSAICGTAAALFVYLATRRLFGGRAGLFAALLFGLNGAAISIGQLAVYDSLALPLMGLSLWLMTRAGLAAQGERGNLAGSGLAMAGAVLGKYLALLYGPAVLAAGGAIYLGQRRGAGYTARRLLTYWALPAVTVLGLYAGYYFDDLQAMAAQGSYHAPGERPAVMGEVVDEIGAAIGLATLGYGLLLWRLRRGEAGALGRYLQGRAGRERALLVGAAACAMMGLLLLSLAGPLYHVAAGNARSLWKHVVFSLMFLAPPAGYLIGEAVGGAVGIRRRGLRVAALAGLLAAGWLFVTAGIERNRLHQRSWPNTAGVIAHLRSAGVDRESRVLAEAMDVYEYYFDFGVEDRLVWSSVWWGYMEQPAAEGGMEVVRGAHVGEEGIRRGYFDFVILDDYYAPGTRAGLGPVLMESGYRVGYREVQEFPGGHWLVLEVYER